MQINLMLQLLLSFTCVKEFRVIYYLENHLFVGTMIEM